MEFMKFSEEQNFFIHEDYNGSNQYENLRIPKKFNKWTLTKKLGAGCFGIIFECIEESSSEKYAIKIEPCKVGCLDKEINQVYKRQNIKNIPKVFDFGEYKGYKYIVIEKLFSIEEINIKIFKKMLMAIENFHKTSGISHNDIKIINFMQNSSGEIVLIDFGMSRPFGYQMGPWNNSNAWYFGNSSYMSINAHNKIFSPRNDVESLLYVIASYYCKNCERDIWDIEKVKHLSSDEILNYIKNQKEENLYNCINSEKKSFPSEWLTHLEEMDKLKKEYNFKYLSSLFDKYQ